MKARVPGTQEPPKNPCRDCDRRHSHCHCGCPEYLAFWNWNREQDDLRQKDANMLDFRIQGMERVKRYMRQMRGKKH